MRTPVKSTMGFIAPESIVPPSPSIKKLVNDTVPQNSPQSATPATTKTEVQPSVQPTPTTPAPVVEPAATATIVPTPAPNPAPATSATAPANVNPVPQPVSVSEPAPIPQPEQTAQVVPQPESTPQPPIQAETTSSPQPVPEPEPISQPNLSDDKDESAPEDETPVTDPSLETDSNSNQSNENKGDEYLERFQKKWSEMVDDIFSKVPTLQAPLKNYPVEIKDNIIYLKLRNSMQVNDFSIKKTAVLQFLRNQFDVNINDVEVSIDEKTEFKKYILDEKDKILELQKQNPDFIDFMKVLNLRSYN